MCFLYRSTYDIPLVVCMLPHSQILTLNRVLQIMGGNLRDFADRDASGADGIGCRQTYVAGAVRLLYALYRR